MIKILIKEKNNDIINLKITGHANSAEYGRDIVCAAVSTSSILSLNLLEAFGFFERNLGTAEVDRGYINVVINQIDENCQVVLETLVNTLEMMASDNDCNEFIKISKVEV